MLLQAIAGHAAQAARLAADTASDVVADPRFEAAEYRATVVFSWLRLVVETIGALVIAAGVAVGVVEFVRASFAGAPGGYTDVRLRLSRFLAVALEFQLGADLLSTAIAPSWNTIRNLAAIAIIRTGLNYFLGREMRDETERLTAAGEKPTTAARRATGSTARTGAQAGRDGAADGATDGAARPGG